MFRAIVCTSAVFMTAALAGCGGGSQDRSPGPTSPTGTTQPSPAPTPITPSGENWTFTVAVSRLTGFEGSFNPSGETVTAVLAPFGSCFNGDQDRARFSGRRSGRSVELQSQPLNGQVIDLSGTMSVAGDVFEGTYSITGGCAHGDRGAARGHSVNVTGTWSGKLGEVPTVIDLRMSNTPDDSAGFAVSGTVKFSGTECFPNATITRRVRGRFLFPDIIGGTQRLELLGLVSDDLSSMRMDYALVAGSCPELTFGSGILTRQ